MTKKPDGGPAFPQPDLHTEQLGMSLRAWLAGQALSNPKLFEGQKGTADAIAAKAAHDAVRLADAVIERLEAEDA